MEKGDFAFPPQGGSVPETPRMPRASVLDDSSSLPSPDQDTSMSDASTESESLGSISIRRQKVSQARKVTTRDKKKKPGTNQGGGDAAKEAPYQEFDPKTAYDGKQGDSIRYQLLSDTFEAISDTKKRQDITRFLTEAFRVILEFNVADILPAVYLCVNELGPPHEGLKLGVGTDIVVKAISSASGTTNLERLKEEYQREGDLGTLAMKKKAKNRLIMEFDNLTISRVHSQFLAIAKFAGDKPMEAKRTLIESLLHASKGAETKYIVRSLLGKLRIGLADQTVLQALGQAFFLHQEGKKRRRSFLQSMEDSVERLKLIYSQCPSFDIVR